MELSPLPGRLNPLLRPNLSRRSATLAPTRAHRREGRALPGSDPTVEVAGALDTAHPPSKYYAMDGATFRIGIDLVGTKIEGLALSRDGAEVARRRIKTPKDYQQTLLV